MRTINGSLWKALLGGASERLSSPVLILMSCFSGASSLSSWSRVGSVSCVLSGSQRVFSWCHPVKITTHSAQSGKFNLWANARGKRGNAGPVCVCARLANVEERAACRLIGALLGLRRLVVQDRVVVLGSESHSLLRRRLARGLCELAPAGVARGRKAHTPRLLPHSNRLSDA